MSKITGRVVKATPKAVGHVDIVLESAPPHRSAIFLLRTHPVAFTIAENGQNGELFRLEPPQFASCVNRAKVVNIE